MITNIMVPYFQYSCGILYVSRNDIDSCLRVTLVKAQQGKGPRNRMFASEAA